MLRDNLAGLIDPMRAARELNLLALFIEQKKSSDDRPQDALKIPAPKGRNLTLTENAASPFHAEPRQVREQWATNEFAFASSAPQDSPRQYAHSLVEGVTPDFLQVSTFLDPNSLTHDDRYKCKSGAIRKRMTALKMARVSGGEISGIVEFSTTPLRLDGRN